jgi:predicted GIY-YIG superfamily endonuclease
VKLTVRPRISETNRDISYFKKSYQPKTNILKDEKGFLVTDSHKIMARWKNHFSRLLNAYRVYDVRQTEIHTAEQIMPQPSACEVEMAIGKLKGTNRIVLIKSQQNQLQQG